MKRILIIVLSAILVLGSASSAEAMNRTRSPGTVNGYPCGGKLPPCFVLYRESRGNPTAQNRRSSASGLWQIIDRTWDGYGGYRKARHAPWRIQNERARIVWNNGKGCRHWRAC